MSDRADPDDVQNSSRPEPPWWTDRKRAVPRDRLSRESIVQAAIRIIDDEGVAAVTLRRLARELDTGPASLYWHVADKDQLFELVYDEVMGEIVLPDPDPSDWANQIKDLARAGYRVMRSHNDISAISLGMVPLGPNMLRIIEWSLTVLRGAGIPDDVAGYFGDLMGRYIDASVLEDVGGADPRRSTGTAAEQRVQRQRFEQMGSYVAGLPKDEFPNLVEMSTSMFDVDGDARFELGLDILVRGLAAHIAAD